MKDFFARPWEISTHGETIQIAGKTKTFAEVRQQQYENIVDETLFIARASEGAVSADWIMTQPIFIRKKYVESFTEELKQREAEMKKARSK